MQSVPCWIDSTPPQFFELRDVIAAHAHYSSERAGNPRRLRMWLDQGSPAIVTFDRELPTDSAVQRVFKKLNESKTGEIVGDWWFRKGSIYEAEFNLDGRRTLLTSVLTIASTAPPRSFAELKVENDLDTLKISHMLQREAGFQTPLA